MDRVSRYSYINAKLKAKLGVMRSSGLIEAMIKAPNLTEAIGLTAGTQYDSLSTVYEQSGDLQAVELELFSREIALQEFIIRSLDERTASFVSVLLKKTERENIKNAVRLWYSANILNHRISYRAAYIYKDRIVNDIDWIRIINALSFDDVKAVFRDTSYYPVFQPWTDQRLANEGLFDFELELDHSWYDELFAAVSHLDKADREVAVKVYLVDVDLKNILNLIRYGYYHSFVSDKLPAVFIPHGSLYSVLEPRIEKGQLSFSDARSLIERRYPAVGSLLGQLDLRTQQSVSHDELAYGTLAVENYLASRRKKEFTSILTGDPFTIGTILSYIYLCKSEDDRIKLILSAKYYGWSEEQIRRELN